MKKNKDIILVSGMIGLGKSSVCDLLAKELGLDVIHESVDDNPILPFLYTASEEDEKRERYPFLLQMWFLNTRYEAMKKALNDGGKILDRAIYEDNYFAEKFLKQGKLNQNEYMIYRKFLNSCLHELSENKTKPTLMVYLKGSFETVMARINERGRDFEIDESLLSYYHDIWKDYDHWMYRSYRASEMVIIDMDEVDIVNNEVDAKLVCDKVKNALEKIKQQ